MYSHFGTNALTKSLTVGFLTLIAGVMMVSPKYANAYHPAPSDSAPMPSVVMIAPSAVKQGETLLIKLKPNQTAANSLAQQTLTATFAGKTLPAYKQAYSTDEYWQVIVPIDVDQKQGGYTLNITDNNKTVLASQKVEVLNGGYSKQNITVSKSTGGLQPAPGELAAIGNLKKASTPESQRWAQPKTWTTPVPECMNSPFGNLRYHNGKFTGRYHKGIDQRSPHGRVVKAPTDGKVALVKNYRLHGGTIGLDHGQGITSIYIHLSKFLVNNGETVKQGQPIGLVGSSGFATGPHLHWGVYVHGQAVNPTQWVNVSRC